MRKKRRILTFLTAAVLFLGLSLPMPVSAANLYFTAINDSVGLLTSDSMPLWYNKTIYVPYTVFDASLNGIGVSLGLNTNYNRNSNLVTLFNLRQMLVFDLNNGTCRDEITGVVYPSRAIMRNGKPYLALNTVCAVFNLEYSYNQLPYIPQGYLVRIKSPETVLDDPTFIDAARENINRRLRDYTQSLNPAEASGSNPTTPTRPNTPPTVDETNTAVYLAFRCESGEGLEEILDALGANSCAVFFLSPSTLEKERHLVRRMLGTGHSVGILAGEETELEQGRLLLEELTHTRTTLACVPEEMRASLENQGWVCWRESLYLEPSDTVGGNAFASSALNRLNSRRTVYLTLAGSGNTARVLPALLRQMNSSNYTVAIPVETQL